MFILFFYSFIYLKSGNTAHRQAHTRQTDRRTDKANQ